MTLNDRGTFKTHTLTIARGVGMAVVVCFIVDHHLPRSYLQS